MPPSRRGGPGRPPQQTIPQTLPVPGQHGRTVLSKRQVTALARTKRKWLGLLRNAHTVTTSLEQLTILKELMQISVQSKAPIFEYLLRIWCRQVPKDVAQQSYAYFVVGVFRGEIKTEAPMTATQRKEMVEQAEQADIKVAYAHLNRLDIPPAAYSEVRAKLIEAVRNETAIEFLKALEARYKPIKQ